MKISLIPVLLFSVVSGFTTSAHSQSAVKDSLLLNEVTILKHQRYRNIEKIELGGWPMFNGIPGVKRIVSLVDEIPDGRLAYVDFYLNCGLPNMMKKTIGIDYKDTEMGLIIYDVAPDGRPGKVISEGEINFTVKATHRGRLRIDTRPLNIHKGALYIGLMPLKELSARPYEIYVRFNENKHAKTFRQFGLSNKWQPEADVHGLPSYQLKMTVGVERT